MSLCTLGAPRSGRAQATPPGGTTPGGAIFDRLRDQTTRPMPLPSSAPPRRPGDDMIWVPDRHVRVPGVEGSVLVPGHWEQRLSEHEVYVPPLTGQTSDGGVIQLPAGRQPPPGERQSP
jgi:hypothetical protein